MTSIFATTTRPASALDTPLRSEGEFLTGWYDSVSEPQRLPAIADEGMNSVMPYHQDGADVLAYLDAALDAGVKVMVEIDRAIVRAGDADAIRSWVAQYKTHPAVSGWFLADEPSTNVTVGPLSAATAELLYQAVKAEDPSRPVVIVFGIDDDLNAYRNAYDVAMYDEYPARVGQPEFTGMDAWKFHLQQRAASTADKQGFIPVIQAFTTGLTGPARFFRLPTPAEARYMTYTAVQAGATGIFYWARYRSTFSFIADVIKPLTSELNRLGPALKGGAVVGVATVNQGPGVVARTYRDPSSGRYSVVVVNHSAQQVDAELSISLGLTSAHIGDTVTDITDGALGAVLQPYEAPTYELSSAPTITDVADQHLDEDTPATVAVTVDDDNTDAESLMLNATSSDQTLLPDANIAIGDGTLTITPATNRSGTATVTLTLTDGDNTTTTDTFDVVVAALNDAPTVSDIADRSTAEDTPGQSIDFTVGDVETAPDNLSVTASSSNATLADISLGGSGADRTLSVTPAPDQSGTTTITVTVTDADGGTSSDTFDLAVDPSNDAPTISDVTSKTTSEGTVTAAIPFSIGDADGPATELTVSGSSSNTALVSNAKIFFAGSGTDRTVKVAPTPGYSGTTTISVKVTDASGVTTTDTFVLTVRSKSGTTLAVSNASIVEGHSGTRYMTFTIVRSGWLNKTSRVNFKTVNGSAASSSDFSWVSGTATLSWGATKTTVRVPIRGDRTIEPNQTLLLALSIPVNASITDGWGTGTIVNDD